MVSVLRGAYGPLYRLSVWILQRRVLLVGIVLMLEWQKTYLSDDVYMGCMEGVVVLP